MIVLHLLFSVLSADIIRDELHRPRPVECVHGNQVVDTGRFELFQIFAHSFRFKLKYADRTAFLIQFKCRRIIQRNIVQVILPAMIFFYKADRRFQNGERFQAQEVHLQHSGILNHFAVELGYVEVGIFGRTDGIYLVSLSGAMITPAA
jgi:hypothetical protein